MAYIHNIFLANSYIAGKRIAYDKTIKKYGNAETAVKRESEKVFRLINKHVGDNAVITNHVIITDKRQWESVVEKDNFFLDVECLKDFRIFACVLKDNNIISELDMKMLLIFLLKKSDPESVYDISIEFDNLCKEYLKDNGKPFYDDDFLTGSRPLSLKTIEKISGVLIDKILSGTNGLNRLNYLFDYVKKRTGKIIFL